MGACLYSPCLGEWPLVSHILFGDVQEISMKESTLVDNIRKALNKLPGVKAIKVHGTPYMKAGTPDILGCCDGQMFALEVKRDETKKPTALQVQQLWEWSEAGAVTAVVWSVASALAVVEGKP